MLEGNLLALRQKRPVFLSMLKTVLLEEKETREISASYGKSKDGADILYIKRGTFSMCANSEFSPLKEAERYVKQYTFEKGKNVTILFGFGNGMILRQILQNAGKEGIVIVYIPSAKVLRETLSKLNVAGILYDRRVQFVVEGAEDKTFEEMMEKYLHWSTLASANVIIHPEYDKIFPISYKMFLEKIRNYKGKLCDAQGDESFVSKISKNIFENFNHIQESNILSEFRGKVNQDCSILLLSSEQFIKDNSAILQQIKNKAFLIAEDAVAGVALDCQVPIDAMISTTATEMIQDLDREEFEEIPMFCYMESDYNNLSLHKGKKIWLQMNSFQKKLYNTERIKDAKVSAFGDARATSVALCAEIGMKNVALEPLLDEEITGQKDSKDSSLENISFLEQEIAIRREVNVFELTGKAGTITGAKGITFEEFQEEYCKNGFHFNRKLTQFNTTFNPVTYQHIKEDMKHTIVELQNIRRYVTDGYKLAGKMLFRFNEYKRTKVDEKELAKLLEFNQYICDQPVYEILKLIMLDVDLELFQRLENCSELDLSNLIWLFDNIRENYQIMGDKCMELLGYGRKSTHKL